MSRKLHSPKLVKTDCGAYVWVCTRCEATCEVRSFLQSKMLPCPGGPVKAHPKPWGNLEGTT